MAESTQGKLDRVRKPRVHIKYEVETEGAEQERELPFVVGVVGDFSGHPSKKLQPLKDRKFIQIDRDNFNDVLKRMTPALNLRVANTMQGDGSEIAVDLKFDSLEDFEPANVAKQVPALQKLLDTRNHLRDLLTKVDRSSDLESILEDAISSTDKLSALASELGITSGGDVSEESAPDEEPTPEGDE